MSILRKKMEYWFSVIAAWFFDHRIKTLVVFLLLFTGLISRLPGLQIDTSVESFFFRTDKYLTDYFEFKNRFGRDDFVVVAVKSDSIFSFDTLNRLRSLQEDLEQNVSHLSDIKSLINIRHTRGEGDFLIVGELIEEWPETEEDLALLKQRALLNPLYRNTVVSEDGTMTAMVLESNLYSSIGVNSSGFDSSFATGSETRARFLTEAENNRFIQAIKAISRQHAADNFQTYVTGSPVLQHELRVTMVEENQLFVSLAMIMVLLFLFRR